MKTTPAQSKSVPSAIPAGRRRFYLAVIAALPFLALLALEAGLRLGGYGYETGFFIKQEAAGAAMLAPNPCFGWRFFPPAVARTPQPALIPAPKARDTLRIVVLGESAAMGDPEPAYGLARMLEVQLAAAWPDRKVEVINAATTAINSHAVREIARDCRPLNADYWVVYMGNNEVVGPFGAGTVFGPRAPSLGLIRAALFMRTLRVGQWVDAARRKLAGGEPANWEGMEMFLRHLVGADDPQLAVVHRHFQRNLDDLLDEASAARARVLLCTVGVNLKDCAPFASLHPVGLAADRRSAFEDLRRRAAEAFGAGEHEVAIQRLTEALALSPKHAETLYLRGRSRLAVGRTDAAREDFEAAREQDALRFRADAAVNRIIADTARARPETEVRLVDIASLLAEHSPARIPGREFFWEHVHFNFDGNSLVARALAERLADWQAVPPVRRLDSEEVGRRLAFTKWDEYQVADQVRRRLEQAPFTGQADHDRQYADLLRRLGFMKPLTLPAAIPVQGNVYRQALDRRPNDWVLRARFAGLLEAAGDAPAASEQWEAVVRLLPGYAEARYRLGSLADQAGRATEAEAHFRAALALQPGSPEVLNGLGLSLLAQDRLADAAGCFADALRGRPNFPAAEVNLALVLARQGRRDDALAHFQAALRLQTNYVAAHVNLGKFLKAEGRREEALAHYETAARLQPEDPVVRFNLANTLAEAGRGAEALPHYEAAAAGAPQLAEIRLNYGLELARLGRDEAALAQLREAARLAPGNGETRLNYGVALARRKAWEEARKEFAEAARLRPRDPAPLANLGAVLAALNQREAALQALEAALKLDPNHAAAQRYLEQLKRR